MELPLYTNHYEEHPKVLNLEEKEYLKQQLDAGVIEPSSSAWVFPVVLVRKKDKSVRWCIDYRKLNDITIKDAYELPRIDLCLDCLLSANIFNNGFAKWELSVATRWQR